MSTFQPMDTSVSLIAAIYCVIIIICRCQKIISKLGDVGQYQTFLYVRNLGLQVGGFLCCEVRQWFGKGGSGAAGANWASLHTHVNTYTYVYVLKVNLVFSAR